MSRFSVAEIVTKGNRRQSLEALRDRLAAEIDEKVWAKHKRECHCVCGIGDVRVVVAAVKELRAVIAELESLPANEEVSKVAQIRASAAAVRDEVAERHAQRQRRRAAARADRQSGSASS